ncbi:hypothetical protein WJX84_009525 [Apatococcus fuscideae]|uniref:Uncharacterized protein n=1 Tax=Apatococcus fuscideae TaxID=2026836 RepID=A0AAW1SZ22_9CHLO
MGNSLESLPESIGDLKQLYRLGLKSNKLKALPSSFGGLQALVELFATDNVLEQLPAEMGQLTSLVKLQLSFNHLQSLPREMGSLPNLELMRVAVNDIKDIPDSFSGLHKLAWFSLAGNPACATPRLPRSDIKALMPHDVPPEEVLGSGASGEVHASTYEGQAVAVKRFVSDISPDGHARDEIAVTCCIDHPNLINVIGMIAEPPSLVVGRVHGQQMAAKPNLQSLLRCRWASDCSFQLNYLLRVAHSTASALEYLHSLGICHGDVYAHNILPDAEGNAVLCDYGASFFYDKGPVPWEAQEVRAFGLFVNDMLARLGTPGFDQSRVQQASPGMQRQWNQGNNVTAGQFGSPQNAVPGGLALLASPLVSSPSAASTTSGGTSFAYNTYPAENPPAPGLGPLTRALSAPAGEAFLSRASDALKHLPDKLAIMCGTARGTLLTKRARILHEGMEISPTEFERVGGRATTKKWKTSVRLLEQDGQVGQTLGDWLQDHDLDMRGGQIFKAGERPVDRTGSPLASRQSSPIATASPAEILDHAGQRNLGMLPGDPTMGELPDEMPPPFDTDGLEMEEIDWGSMDHHELMAWTAQSMTANTNAHLFQNPPGVAMGRQAFITGQEPTKRQRVVQQALGTEERIVQMVEHLEGQRAEPPWGAFGNRSIPTLSGRVVDLKGLWRCCKQQGGFEQTCKDRKWPSIAKELGITGISNGGHMCRQHYKTYLLGVEQQQRLAARNAGLHAAAPLTDEGGHSSSHNVRLGDMGSTPAGLHVHNEMQIHGALPGQQGVDHLNLDMLPDPEPATLVSRSLSVPASGSSAAAHSLLEEGSIPGTSNEDAERFRSYLDGIPDAKPHVAAFPLCKCQNRALLTSVASLWPSLQTQKQDQLAGSARLMLALMVHQPAETDELAEHNDSHTSFLPGKRILEA